MKHEELEHPLEEQDGIAGLQDTALEGAETSLNPSEETPEEPKSIGAKEIAQHIRDVSLQAHLVSRMSLKKDPLCVPEEELPVLLEEMGGLEECKDIVPLKGKEDLFYYSSDKMSNNYATMLLLAEDDDIHQTISNRVRHECRTYPRPASIHSLAHPPLRISQDQVLAALTVMETIPEYQDIHLLTCSNGKQYLYSTQYMSEKYACSLANWEETSAHEYP